MMLVDLAKHVGGMFAEDGSWKFGDAMTRLREGFDAEWESPTDTPGGQISG